MDDYDIDWSCAEQGPETPDDDFDDGAYERQQQRQEQRYLENDANWELT